MSIPDGADRFLEVEIQDSSVYIGCISPSRNAIVVTVSAGEQSATITVTATD